MASSIKKSGRKKAARKSHSRAAQIIFDQQDVRHVRIRLRSRLNRRVIVAQEAGSRDFPRDPWLMLVAMAAPEAEALHATHHFNALLGRQRLAKVANRLRHAL